MGSCFLLPRVVPSVFHHLCRTVYSNDYVIYLCIRSSDPRLFIVASPYAVELLMFLCVCVGARFQQGSDMDMSVGLSRTSAINQAWCPVSAGSDVGVDSSRTSTIKSSLVKEVVSIMGWLGLSGIIWSVMRGGSLPVIFYLLLLMGPYSYRSSGASNEPRKTSCIRTCISGHTCFHHLKSKRIALLDVPVYIAV